MVGSCLPCDLWLVRLRRKLVASGPPGFVLLSAGAKRTGEERKGGKDDGRQDKRDRTSMCTCYAMARKGPDGFLWRNQDDGCCLPVGNGLYLRYLPWDRCLFFDLCRMRWDRTWAGTIPSKGQPGGPWLQRQAEVETLVWKRPLACGTRQLSFSPLRRALSRCNAAATAVPGSSSQE